MGDPLPTDEITDTETKRQADRALPYLPISLSPWWSVVGHPSSFRSDEMNDHDVVIVSAVRTPIGKFQGAYKDVPATELGATAVRAAVARAGMGQAPARQAALQGGLPSSVGALTINKVCGSSLKAVMLASALIRGGDAEVIVAGGMESMTRAPYM